MFFLGFFEEQIHTPGLLRAKKLLGSGFKSDLSQGSGFFVHMVRRLISIDSPTC